MPSAWVASHHQSVHTSEIVLWLFVINLGIACGAGLYETRIMIAPWIGAVRRGDDATLADVGREFWAFVTTIPLTLLTLISVAMAWGAGDAWTEWWLWAAVFSLIERVMTFGYFIPTMLKLQRRQAASVSQMQATAIRWTALNYVRSALTFAAWIVALKALSVM